MAVTADQGGVASVLREQFLVRATLCHTAVVEDDDLVRVPDGGEPVRDGERGAPLRQGVDGLLYSVFRTGVEGAGRLVEDQHGRVPENGAGDGQPLLLAT